MSEPIKLEVGRTYRAKKPRPVSCGFDRVVNDRTVLFVGAFEVQYDSPAVGNGRHYPRMSIEKFCQWCDRDVTAELPPGDWASWPPAKAKGGANG